MQYRQAWAGSNIYFESRFFDSSFVLFFFFFCIPIFICFFKYFFKCMYISVCILQIIFTLYLFKTCYFFCSPSVRFPLLASFTHDLYYVLNNMNKSDVNL